MLSRHTCSATGSLYVFAAIGCRTDIGGVTSINEAPAVNSDPSIAWFSNKKETPLTHDFEPDSNVSGPSRQLLNVADEVPRTEVAQINQDFEKISYPPESLDIVVSKYIGLTVDEAMSLARQQGDVFRVTSDGGHVTADLCPGRITARTKDGIVQSISVERDWR